MLVIQIERNPNPPQSLSTPEIQRYLDDLDAYKIDQQLPKDQQTLSKPKCSEKWRDADLFEEFDACFFAKCYLTEQKFATSWSMDVEHFVSRQEHPDLTYQWTNLYPAEHAANMMKPRTTPVGGYLDPCAPNDAVESELLYHIDFNGQKVSFGAMNPLNIKAINTANLLNHLHNGTSHETQKRTAELRFAIYKKRDEVLNTIIVWRNAQDQNNAQAEFEAQTKLQGLLSRKSAFTMLMRSISAVRMMVPPEFLD
ncbi:hypothetical protein [Tellurirhabdus bombi]|uniref:hypothetical protein n=1 Tax=Tellurirhabdus bombi TaxID=2907205 RepID=UPI001F3761F0|nr:hypothetical protein [Tellurirhabdus bombi]